MTFESPKPRSDPLVLGILLFLEIYGMVLAAGKAPEVCVGGG